MNKKLKLVPTQIEEAKNEIKENRKEAGRWAENLHENRDSFYSVNIDNFIDNYDVSKANREFVEANQNWNRT